MPNEGSLRQAQKAQTRRETVFNYFPAEEDMFFEFSTALMPDFAAAIRQRPAGSSPIAALRGFVRAELERRAESAFDLLETGLGSLGVR